MHTAIIILSTVLSAPATVSGNPQRGLQIAHEAERRDSGWNDMTVRVTMTLRRADGRQAVRQLRIRSIEVEGDGDKSLTIFDQPRDVKGTAFLSFTHKTGNDDQWLYLPSIGRVKRISSSNRSGPFMGSEFAYEDISSEEVERYTYRYLREEPCGEGRQCFVIERYPVDKTSGYTKQVVWIDKAEYRYIKTDYYDRKRAHVKTLLRRDFRRYDGKFWRAAKWEMTNVQNGKSTTVEWKDYAFGNALTDRDFDRSALKRVK